MTHRGLCASHVKYNLSCDELEELEQRAAGRCERCGITPLKFVIDHDHNVGPHAVRGLLCYKCNSGLAQSDRAWRTPDALDLAYLQKAWHVTADRSGTVLRVVRVKIDP